MVSDRDSVAERQARIDAMHAEFRTARQRTLVKRGVPTKVGAEVAPDDVAQTPPLPEKPK